MLTMTSAMEIAPARAEGAEEEAEAGVGAEVVQAAEAEEEAEEAVEALRCLPQCEPHRQSPDRSLYSTIPREVWCW